jgi:hypothetical protein
MIDFHLPMAKRWLWVSRVFERNPKLTLNSQALVNGWDYSSNVLDKHGKEGG